MKFNKLFSVLALSLMTLTMSAAITSKATLKVQSGYGPYDLLYLYEDNSETQLVDDILNTVNAASVNLYAVINDVHYSSVKQASLENLKLEFKANSLETSYTVTFSNVVGNISVKLGENTYVAEDGVTFNITCETGASVDLVVNPAAPQKDYTRDAATVIGNWYTICVPGGVDATEYASVMDVYTVAGYSAGNGLAVDPLEGAMQPGVPYIFKAEATLIEFDYNAAVGATDPQEGANYLTGTFENMQTENVAYVVANNLLNWAAAGTTVPANRAFLDYADITDGNFPVVNDTDNAPGRKFIAAPRGAATDMQEVKAMEGTRKAIVNGRLVIIREGRMFNALGGRK